MKDNIHLINAWIDKAEHDLVTAHLIFNHLPEYFDTICYHCQQSAEKYLKATLISNDIDFQKKHNLDYLLNLLSKALTVSDDIYEKAVKLDSYSVNIRYPDETIPPTKEEIEEALQIAEDIKHFVLKFL